MSESTAPPKKVLVVDDEMDMRIFLSTVMKTSGYETVTTREGAEGIRKAKEIKPDLVIMDVMMPGEGGVQMYRALKTDPDLARIPVIMVSAVESRTFFHYLNMLNTRLETPVPNPAAYLEKPIDPEDLLQAAAEIFN